jgi:hypothetical protein
MSTENTKEVAKSKSNLPKLDELHYDIALAFKNDELNLLLNQEPPVAWVKKHPIVKKKIRNEQGQEITVPSEFIPVDRIELLLTRIFQVWNVEILREGALFNSVYVTIRLHYKDPITGEMRFHDGTGAVAVQTDAGKSASDLGAIKSAAIQMALPAAESYALKDAAEKLGKLFGKDINRQSAIDFTMAYQSSPKTINDDLETSYEEIVTENIPKKVAESIMKAPTKTAANAIWKANPNLQQFPEFMSLIEKRHAEITLAIMQNQAQQTTPQEGDQNGK